MADKPSKEFGTRRPAPVPAAPREPVKRSGHVALLVMGTIAVGTTAYTLMPRQNCDPASFRSCVGADEYRMQQRPQLLGRRLAVVVAIELLQQRFLQPFFVRDVVRLRLGWRDARRLRLLCTRLLERRLRREVLSSTPHAALL